MERDKTRQPFRKALLAFSALRGIELATLVSAAAILDAISGLADGLPFQLSLIGPLLAAAAFYLSFAYIVVSASAFLLQWLSRRHALIKLANALPLLVWGLLALYVVFGLNVPVTLALTLMFGVVVNWFAARAFENTGPQPA
ncbi:hypothetical protein ACW7G0_12575 [Lysobacter sp. A286]